MSAGCETSYIIDIVPTILEVTGVNAPETVEGIAQKPIEGESTAYTFDKAAPSTRQTQYFEMIANAASITKVGKPTRRHRAGRGY